MPVFLSTPKSDVETSLPFKFTGGLGMSTSTIGFMLAIQGIYSMIAQLWLFPFVVRRFGTLKTFRFVLLVWPPLYLAVPYLILLPTTLQIPAVYCALIGKITLHVIAFPTIAILLANAAPSSKVLGSINGAAASTASLGRALGPTITGFLHSKGLASGYSVLAWWACGIMCLVGAVESFCMEETTDSSRFHGEKQSSSAEAMKMKAASFSDADGNDAVEEAQRLLSSNRSSVDVVYQGERINFASTVPGSTTVNGSEAAAELA